MRILQAGACVAFERGHSGDVERVLIHSLSAHVLHHHGGDGEGVGDFLRVGDLRVLGLVALHDFVHRCGAFVEDVGEVADGAAASRHALHRAEIHVCILLDIFFVLPAHLFENL
jgi:hypothetical protein